MAGVSNASKALVEAVSAKVAQKAWNKLSPEAKRQIMKVNMDIIRRDMTRQAVRNPKNIVLAGAVGVGVAAGLYVLFGGNSKKK